MKTRKIQPGHVVATPNALRALESAVFLERHQSGDWGDVCQDDWNSNDLAAVDGSRSLSAYSTRLGEKIWVITEAERDDGNRTATTILLPADY